MIHVNPGTCVTNDLRISPAGSRSAYRPNQPLFDSALPILFSHSHQGLLGPCYNFFRKCVVYLSKWEETEL